MGLESDLRAATDDVLAGESERGLERLVKSWRKKRQPELAELAEMWAAQLAASEPPAVGGKGSARASWLEVSAKKRTASLPRLFASLPDTTGPYAAERLESLLDWEPNPVIAAALTKWLGDSPFVKKARAQCSPALLSLLRKQEDPRCVAALERCAKKRRETVNELGLSAWKPLNALLETARDWAKPMALTASEAGALGELRARLGTPSASGAGLDPLWKQVFSNPADDTARLVLSDALQERKDPRGEFIALQLKRHGAGGKPSARETELLALWRADWLGPIDQVLVGDTVFERGFPVAGKFINTGVPDAASDWPQWATFERLDASNAAALNNPVRAAICSPHARALVEVRAITHADFEAISQSERPLPMKTVTASVWDARRLMPLLLKPAPLPSLTRLGLLGPFGSDTIDAAWIARLLDAPLGKPLRALELHVAGPVVGQLFRLAAVRGLDEAIAVPDDELTLGFAPATGRLVVEVDSLRGRTTSVLEAAMTGIPKGLVKEATLELRSRDEKHRAQLSSLVALTGVKP